MKCKKLFYGVIYIENVGLEKRTTKTFDNIKQARQASLDLTKEYKVNGYTIKTI